MKQCNKCKVEKSLTSFNKRKSAKDGLQYWCIECMTTINTKWKKNILK